MVKLEAHKIWVVSQNLRRLQIEAETFGSLSDHSVEELTKTTTTAEQLCISLELGSAADLPIQALREEIGKRKLRLPWSITGQGLDAARRGIITELEKRKFAYIPLANAKYFERERLFGEEIYDAFPSAQPEIKDAGNCIAAGLSTAAVFHLMRTAEFGMRALAKERHVQIKHIELDYADWQQLISQLNKKADEVAQWKGRGVVKSTALEFYRGAVRQLDGFKEEFRNHVMHTRRRYDINQALSAFSRVQEFMQRLVDNGLWESQTKSIRWKKPK